MNILAINSSLRGGGHSKTELMTNHLVDGMREAGAEVEMVNLRDKEIRYCVGCYTCMTKAPGRCALDDDMTNEIFPKWLAADLVVYATPLFYHTVNAPMKAFIERTFPVVEPFLEQRDDERWTHPLRHRFPKAMVLSVCGFPEESAFGALQHYVRFLFGERLVAEIYRPGAEMLTHQKASRDDVLDATRRAGRELVTSMCITPETMARITQPLVDDVQSFSDIANLMWSTCITEGVTPRTLQRRGMPPRPDSVESFAKIMPIGFNPRAARDAEAVLQFVFSGEVEGACAFIIDHGTIEATLGLAENPDLTIRSPFGVWMDVMAGKVDGEQVFIAGEYTAEGNISLLMKMDAWFSSDEAGPTVVEETRSHAAKEANNRSRRCAYGGGRPGTVDQEIATCRALVMGMPTAFNAEAADGINAEITFQVTGEEPGDYTLRIADGTCMAHEGASASPDLTIKTPSDVWMAISRGELDGQQAFMEGKYQATGDFGLLLKLNDLFGAA